MEGKEIKKWKTPESSQKLILFESRWTKENYSEDLTEDQYLALVQNDFSEIFDHLMAFKERAKKRYDKGNFWWELRNCAYYELFEKSKIIFPNLQNSNKFSFDKKGNYINAPAVFLPTNDVALLGILNSKLIWEFLKSICVIRSGGYIEVKPQYFEQIPIPEIKNGEELESKVNKIINFVSENQKIADKFISYFSYKFQLNKLPRKLQNWHELEFGEFIKELNKAIKKNNREREKEGLQPVPELTKKDEFEWMELFEENKKKAVVLQQQISATDKEIDQMVYELYGLTEEEIEIVEKS